jgi:hypothetical protein
VLGESDAQACIEEKRGGEGCGETRGWCSPFIGGRGSTKLDFEFTKALEICIRRFRKNFDMRIFSKFF